MHTIEKTYHIQAPLAKVWEALTDASVAEQWGAAPAQMDATEGDTFSYWGGDIHGINTKVVPQTVLEQDGYGHNYPERIYKVTFNLHEDNGATTVSLRQTNVHDDELQDVKDGWLDYYFNPIKELLEK